MELIAGARANDQLVVVRCPGRNLAVEIGTNRIDKLAACDFSRLRRNAVATIEREAREILVARHAPTDVDPGIARSRREGGYQNGDRFVVGELGDKNVARGGRRDGSAAKIHGTNVLARDRNFSAVGSNAGGSLRRTS